ncbi:MAG TPA: hypothetical protein VF533_21245 [Solirubrobacteraceae bacterium]|jgi:hypothetical protein
MAAQTASLLLAEDLDDPDGTPGLDAADRDALRSLLKWVREYVVRPNPHIGRPGTVCPYVPGSLDRRTLWFAPERVAELEVADVVALMDGYRRLFLDRAPLDGHDAVYKTIMVVFPDLPAERAKDLFAEVLGELAEAAFEQDGIIYGPYYEGNEAPAVHNMDFRPFESPVPFMFVRHTVAGDWKFFIDDDAALDRWARRVGAAGAIAVAKQLRRFPWRANPV